MLKAPIVDTPTTLVSNYFDNMPEAIQPVFYDTTDYKLPILTIDGKEYLLVEKLTRGEESGLVQAGTTVVTYVYVLQPSDPILPEEPSDSEPLPPVEVKDTVGQVIVRYLDIYGNVIASEVVDTEDVVSTTVTNVYREDGSFGDKTTNYTILYDTRVHPFY